jgi:tryptophan synthase alpha chain
MTNHHNDGIAALQTMFAAAKMQGRSAFLPYFPIGYPDYATSLKVIETLSDVGVDGFEIGMPFSDPLADGPVIQSATQVALGNGVTVRTCLQAVRELRQRGIQQPMILMGYFNPILSYGIDRFTREASAAGAAGVIIPDLPPEEAEATITACEHARMAHIFFLAPTSNSARIELVSQKASGFIYLVSLTGVTGMRSELSPDLKGFISRARAKSTQPLVLGFGISTPDHVRSINTIVDGFIVGSALVKAAADGIEAVRALAHSLRGALDAQDNSGKA